MHLGNTIDRFLLDSVYEPVSHWAERYFGITRFVLSRCCLFVWGGSGVAYYGYPVNGGAITVMSAVMVACVLAGVSLGLINIRTAERLTKPGLVFPFDVPGFRFVLLALLVLDVVLGYWLVAAANAAFLSHLYFCLCPPPPPARESNVIRGEIVTSGA